MSTTLLFVPCLQAEMVSPDEMPFQVVVTIINFLPWSRQAALFPLRAPAIRKHAADRIKRSIVANRIRLLDCLICGGFSATMYRAAHCLYRDVEVTDDALRELELLEAVSPRVPETIAKGRRLRWRNKKIYRAAFRFVEEIHFAEIGW